MTENMNWENEWWYSWGKEIVENDSTIWEKKKFKPLDGYWITVDGGKLLAKVVENENVPKDAVIERAVWDHEHCGICLKKISEHDGDQHEGYTGEGKWVCPECFEKY